MKIAKSIYTFFITLSIAGMTFFSPAALYAATESITSHNNAVSASPASNQQLPELLQRIIAGQATGPEYREVLGVIIQDTVLPLLDATHKEGDTAFHTQLSKVLGEAQKTLSNPNAATEELKQALDALIATMAPILVPMHDTSTSSGISNGTGGANAPTTESAIEKTEEEKLLDTALKQLNTLDLMLAELALIVENNTVKVSNKRDHLEKIKHLRSIIFRADNSAYTQIDNSALLTLITLTTKILENLHDALHNGFQEFPAIDMDQLIIRSHRTDITHEELQDRLDENEESIESVDLAAKNAGLLWYNKIYRVFDKYIVQTGQKYKVLHPDFPFLGSRAKMALYGAAAYLIVAFITESENRHKEETPILDRTGYYPRFKDSSNKDLDTTYHDPSDAQILAYKDMKKNNAKPEDFLHTFQTPYPIKKRPLWPTKIGLPIGWLSKMWQQADPVLFYILPLFAMHTSKELKNSQEWINKKLHTLANFLKGGAYLNQKTAGIDRIIPKVTMKDLVGLRHVVEKFEPYVNYFDNPEKCERSKTTPGRFLLLTGPTRTGKTHSAEALAGSIIQRFKETGRNPDDFNFFVLQASSIASSSSSINDLLKLAEEFAPCIIFIDEIDLLQLQRAGGNSQRLSEFLTGMSGALSDRDLSKPVIMMAATNHPENLDVALRQPGRFQEIRFEYPSYSDRLTLLQKRLEPLIPNMEELNLEKLARETEGASYAALEAMVRGGFQNARMKGERLAQSHLEHALDTEVRGIIMQDGYPLNSDEKQLLAVHQAGHALATILLGGNLQLSKVSIRPYLNEIKEETTFDRFYKEKEKVQKKIEHGKTYTFHAEETHGFMSSEETLKECKFHLAGHIAEKILFGECSYSYHKEDSTATDKLLEPIVTKGRDINLFPDEIKTQYKKRMTELCAQCEVEMMELLKAYRPALIAIAQALEAKESLSCSEVLEIALNAQQAYAAKTAPAKSEAPAPVATHEATASQEQEATTAPAVSVAESVTNEPAVQTAPTPATDVVATAAAAA